jgi:hypothetical protein
VIAVCAGVTAGTAQAGPQQAGVQVALRALGLYAGPVDGVVGSETAAAVRSAQARFHLPVTGRIDARTRRALGPLGTPLLGDRPVHPGDFGLDVAVVQFALAERGLYRGALDGYLGARTERAVRRFQLRAHLAVDGIVGPATAKALLHVPVPRPRTRLRAETSAGVVRDRLDVWANRLGVSQHLVRALAWMESGFQPQVESDVGAEGVMQVLPVTRSFVEEVLVGKALPASLDGDIETGVLYLRHLLRNFDGDERLAIAAWYQGERAVREHGIFPETKVFVSDVLALRARM